ncbi:MAG: hypothetical protein M1827_001130 [Pycnora praestabilis]|nr:MAG: hypothetical protein M1827_001130 [Pycnora praestabilis]
MHSGPDSLGAPSSFTARRSAASNLPTFELPPPQLSQLPKYQPFSAINATQPPSSNISVGNLLTPPSNNSGDCGLSPISSGIHSGSSASNQGLPPYTPNGYWAPPLSGTTPYGFSSGHTPQPLYAGQTALNPLFPPRGMFSPSLGSLMRNNSNSPTASEGLPPPPYDLNLPPFPTSMSMSAPASLPAFAAQQQAMANALMNAQTPVTNTTTQPSPISATEPYGMQRQQPTPSYYGGSPPSSTPQQANFPSFTAPSPTQQSPLTSTAPSSRISPTNPTHPPILQPAPSQQSHHFSRPFSSYSLPAMSGPIMSNVHSPGSQMALVGGMPGGMMSNYNPGQTNSMQHMYGGPQQTQQQPQNDRPFKCDQCPQSFNRNHDLKRHKRIHLAVKPFPCGHCEKSFSRKDALKRHILVKGCGKSQSSSDSIEKLRGSDSPIDKDEPMSSDAEDSPVLTGHAIKVEL